MRKTKLQELLDEVREADRQIEILEQFKEAAYIRIDEELEKEGGI